VFFLHDINLLFNLLEPFVALVALDDIFGLLPSRVRTLPRHHVLERLFVRFLLQPRLFNGRVLGLPFLYSCIAASPARMGVSSRTRLLWSLECYMLL
jgi:hypothetical protein